MTARARAKCRSLVRPSSFQDPVSSGLTVIQFTDTHPGNSRARARPELDHRGRRALVNVYDMLAFVLAHDGRLWRASISAVSAGLPRRFLR